MKRKSLLVLLLSLSIVAGAGFTPNNVYAATMGDQVVQTEEGWQRVDSSNTKIHKSSFFEEDLDENSYGGNINSVQDNSWGREMHFAFYGSKLRLYFDNLVSEKAEGVISFDNGETWEKFDPHTKSNTMVYEKEGLDLEVHEVRIKVFYDTEFSFECLDIDNDGELVDTDSITINKTKLNLVVNEQEQLSLPNVNWGNKVDKELWSSSDESVATVDKNGLVTAVGAGEATITARIEGRNLVKVCKVIVKEPEVEVGTVQVPELEDSTVIGGNKLGAFNRTDLESFLGNQVEVSSTEIPEEVLEKIKNGNITIEIGDLVIDPALKGIVIGQEPGNSDIKLTIGENEVHPVKIEISDTNKNFDIEGMNPSKLGDQPIKISEELAEKIKNGTIETDPEFKGEKLDVEICEGLKKEPIVKLGNQL